MLNLIVAAIMMNVSDAPPKADREEEERILERLHALEEKAAFEEHHKNDESEQIELAEDPDEEARKREQSKKDALVSHAKHQPQVIEFTQAQEYCRLHSCCVCQLQARHALRCRRKPAATNTRSQGRN